MKKLRSIQAYPLQWPLGWARTKIPKRSLYKLPLERALQELTTELRLFRAKDFVVSSNVEPRLAGLPRGPVAATDPGVAVYWDDVHGRPRVMACDAWDSVRGNVRAVAVTINALRQIERSGATQLLERAFTGFVALPADAGASSWREVLQLSDNGSPNGGRLRRQLTQAEVEAAYKRRALEVHPDRGGSNEDLIAVNRARDEALRELRSNP
jgi:hypothetical protein